MRWQILLLAALIFNVSCASYFKRKECEKTNMYQHGYDVAMSGKRLDADDFVRQCQKVEAKFSFTDLDTGFKAGMSKYCTSDNIYDVGKAGKPFAYEMCDGESASKMRARYTEGLRVFCTPQNAYRFGTSGGVYQNVCPKNGENEWLTEYRKGRKIYLAAVIEEKEKEAHRIDGELATMESRRMLLTHQLNMANQQTEVRTERIWDAKTGTYQERTSRNESPEGKMRAQQLSGDLSNLNYQIQLLRDKQKTLQTEVSAMRTEMVTL